MSTLTPTLSRFEARERELTSLLALYRASKREREGTRGEAVGRVRVISGLRLTAFAEGSLR